MHRSGSNVVNGRYYVDHDPRNTIGHYSAFRSIDVAALRARYERTRATPPAEDAGASLLVAGAGPTDLPRYFTIGGTGPDEPARRGPAAGEVQAVIRSLNEQGYWPAELGYTSHPYRGRPPATVTPGDFSRTHVGDEYDTSPYRVEGLIGISSATYIRNMGVLIRWLDDRR